MNYVTSLDWAWWLGHLLNTASKNTIPTCNIFLIPPAVPCSSIWQIENKSLTVGFLCNSTYFFFLREKTHLRIHFPNAFNGHGIKARSQRFSPGFASYIQQEPNNLSHDCCLPGSELAESWNQEPEWRTENKHGEMKRGHSSCHLSHLAKHLPSSLQLKVQGKIDHNLSSRRKIKAFVFPSIRRKFIYISQLFGGLELKF